MQGTRQKQPAKASFISRLRNLDLLSKGALIVLISTIAYVLLLFLLKPLIIPADSALGHTTVMGDHVMSFESPEQSTLNIMSLLGAVVAGAITAFAIRTETMQPHTKPQAVDELSIIKRALSRDEKKAVGAIEQSGEITQDSLTFRLGWSRAKTSIILTNLERMNLIQRRREGKTYTVFLAKK